MFADCTSLVYAPVLPAPVIAESCYYGMFENCTSLTMAYNIGAVVLADNCFGNMFLNCHKLISVSITYAGGYFPNYFGNWVYGIPDVTGIFYYDGDLTAQYFGFPANWITSDQ